jgi:hypothetical protein
MCSPCVPAAERRRRDHATAGRANGGGPSPTAGRELLRLSRSRGTVSCAATPSAAGVPACAAAGAGRRFLGCAIRSVRGAGTRSWWATCRARTRPARGAAAGATCCRPTCARSGACAGRPRAPGAAPCTRSSTTDGRWPAPTWRARWPRSPGLTTCFASARRSFPSRSARRGCGARVQPERGAAPRRRARGGKCPTWDDVLRRTACYTLADAVDTG